MSAISLSETTVRPRLRFKVQGLGFRVSASMEILGFRFQGFWQLSGVGFAPLLVERIAALCSFYVFRV